MAYNNYFPYGYQPFNYQQTPPYNPQSGAIPADYGQGLTNTRNVQNNAANPLIWVQGEAGAKAYPVAPNTTVCLWDSESQTVYLKTADQAGMPSMKILDYTVREDGKRNDVLQKSPAVDLSGYVTREEFERRFAEITKKSGGLTDE